MRYRARFQAALVTAVAQMAPICGAFFVLVLAYGLFKGMPIEPRDWNLLIGVFGGTLVLTSLAMSVSELFDWYEVDASGLTYRARAGVGGARLFMKKTASVAWREIVEAHSPRWQPYRSIELRIERPYAESGAESGAKSGNRHESLSLPLYVRDQERFLKDLDVHVPADHPLRGALDDVTL